MHPHHGVSRLGLIAVILLAVPIVGSSAATAAKRTSPHHVSCADATGARWHIKHFFFRYDSHGAVVSGEASRLPASGHRYTGYLFESPRGYLCAASLDETNSAVEKGDNRHFGFCVEVCLSQSHGSGSESVHIGGAPAVGFGFL
jgi:hypothetical protein